MSASALLSLVDRLTFFDRLNNSDVLDGHGIHGEWVPVEDHEIRELAGFK